MKPLLLACASLLLAGAPVFAQPATDGAPKAANPGNMGGALTPQQKADEDKHFRDIPALLADMKKRREAIMAQTPEEDEEEMRQKQEPLLRQSLNQAGFRDLKLQDAVLEFVAAQEQSRRKARQAAAKIYGTPKPLAAPAMEAALANYLQVAGQVKAEREVALQALDQKIGFSADPRLKAHLSLYGLIGDASFFTAALASPGNPDGVAPIVLAARAAAAPKVAQAPEALPAPPQTPEQKAKQEKEYREAYNSGAQWARKTMQMTPEQLRDEMLPIRASLLRRDLERAGYKDAETLDAIAAFVARQEKARQPVREMAGKVYLALTPRDTKTGPVAMQTLLLGYENAVEVARRDRVAATQALDGQIDLASKPRLKAMLTLRGLLGDASWFTGYVLPTGALSLEALTVAL